MFDSSTGRFVVILICLFLSTTESYQAIARTNQQILIGPEDIYTYQGETVQFPCIVSKQSDAIVTWCWNDFCTLGKAQLIRQESSIDGVIKIYRYTAYPRFYLSINEQLNHYNLSISPVTNNDEGIFQCQVQRTMQANEARSERVYLTVIDPPNDQPRLLIPDMPLRQDQLVNITCLSSPSKPASNLVLYKNDEILRDQVKVFYEKDLYTKKNLTKIIYTISKVDSNWNNVIVRCEQIYISKENSKKEISRKIEVFYKPKVRIESQSHSPLIVNSTATFRCIVHGNPSPEFRWFAHSIDLTSVTSSKINIPLTKQIHNHSIGCTVRNSLGTMNATIRLLIRYPPIILVRPPKLVILDFDRKSPLNLPIVRCLVDSYPRARITWYRHGELLVEGSIFNLESITKHEQQGIYIYRIETDGFEPIEDEFIIYIKGKPLIYIQESKDYHQMYECQIYSSSPILRINWKLNDQTIKSNPKVSITTSCDQSICLSKLIYTDLKFITPSKLINRLLCLAENEFGIEQSRLYHIEPTDDPSMILIFILLTTLILILFSCLIVIYCCCRVRKMRREQYNLKQKNLPHVFDEHYSINDLIKEVGSLKTCHTDQLSVKNQSTDRLLTNLFNNNTKKLLDNLSNESSTNSSGFHSSKFEETIDFRTSGISPLYTGQH